MSVTITRSTAERAPDPHLEALVRPFEGTTQNRVRTMIERALQLGHERDHVMEAWTTAQTRYDRATANAPSRFSDECSGPRRRIIDKLESECEALESRMYSIDARFQGVTR